MDKRRFYYKMRNLAVLLLLMNIAIMMSVWEWNIILNVFGIVFLALSYLYVNLKPIKLKNISKRVNIMIGGYELIVDCALLVLMESALYIILLFNKPFNISYGTLIINGIIAGCVLALPLFNGIIRMMFTSIDLGLIDRILIIFCWWIPILNIFILKKWCVKSRYEYYVEGKKNMRNSLRKESEVCNTKYPIVMVHGIFFRDWMFINYWGRIPKELMKNGATIYYGHQQSSNSICKSAKELKDNIMDIINETHCEKVNIIAHSKGGLDARYAISCLGLSDHVASLTTINTPHRGCRYTDFLLDKIPAKAQKFIASRYNKIFVKLGDKNPDFLAGVNDLRASSCNEFNKKVLDDDNVYYQSVTSKMKNVFSAPFPLNAGYILTGIFDGRENDGLVEVSSAKWGDFKGILKTDKRGISHGDVIDMTRQNIKGYDVCEYYVRLVKELKDRGL